MPNTQTVRFKDFRAGIADNPYYTMEGQFIDCSEIDFRRKAPLVTPHLAASTSKSFTTGSSLLRCAVGDLMFGEGGLVYDLDSTGSATHTVTGTPTIYSAGKLGDKTVFIYEGTNIILGYYDGSWTDSWSTTGATITKNTAHEYPVAEFQGKLFIGSGTSLFAVTSAGVVTEEFSDRNANIVGLANEGQILKWFEADGNVYYWDGTENTAYNEKKPLGEPIRTVYDTHNAQYIITGEEGNGSDTKIYKMVGYDIQLIGSYLEGIECFSENEGNPSQMVYTNGLVFFPGIKNDATSDPQCVYSYGTNSKVLPASRSCDYETSDGGYSYSKISCLHYYKGYLYIAYSDSNGTEGVDAYYLNPNAGTSKSSSGFIIPKLFDGGNRNRKKKITRIRYHGNTTSDVVIKYNTDKYYQGDADRKSLIADDYSDFTTLVTFDNTDSAEQNSRYGKEVDAVGYIFLFKIELGANSTLSELEVDFIYLD